MSEPDVVDRWLRELSSLPVVTPSADHADRVRRRCLARLGTKRPNEARVAGVLEPACIGTACALYWWEILQSVFR